MKSTASLLGTSSLVTFVFILLAAVLLGTLRYFSDATAEVISASLSDCVTGLLLPLLLFCLHLPLLLLLPLKNFYSRATIRRSRGKLFLSCTLLIFFLNPVTLLWIYSLAVKTPVGNFDFGLSALLVTLVCAAIAAAAGLWGTLFSRPAVYPQ